MDKAKIFKFCFGCDPEMIAPKVIITPVVTLAAFKQYINGVSQFRGKVYSVLTGDIGGEKISVVQSGIGDRLFGDAVLFLGNAGAREVIFIGSCGGLMNKKIGDVFIAETAMNGEGFSRYYEDSFSVKRLMGESRIMSADNDTVKSLYEAISAKEGMDPAPEKANIFTIGSLLAEEEHILAEIQSRGFSGIEMELSAVYRAAKTAGIKSAGVLVVSDLPLDQPLENKGARENYRKSMDIVVESVVEFLGR